MTQYSSLIPTQSESPFGQGVWPLVPEHVPTSPLPGVAEHKATVWEYDASFWQLPHCVGASVSANADPGWPVAHTLAACENSKKGSQVPAATPALSHSASYMMRGESFGSLVSLSPVRSAETQVKPQNPSHRIHRGE
jgi:hypothetical protein